MRRGPLLLLVMALLGATVVASAPSGARRYKSSPPGNGTTLDRTIVGEGRDLEYGQGRKRVFFAVSAGEVPASANSILWSHSST